MTTSPAGQRRRRIAGERRPARPLPSFPGEAATPSPVVPKPVRVLAPDDAQAPADSDAPATPPTGARVPPAWVPPTLVTALVLLLGLAVALLLRYDVRELREADAVDAARRAAPAAAEVAAPAVLSYRHDSLARDRERASRFLTEDFDEEFAPFFDELVAPTAQDTRAVVEARVRSSGVAAATPDRVEVVLFVDQTTTSTAHAEPRTALTRVVFTMQRLEGRWLVDDVSAF